jgi:hypothetical protein
MRFPCPDAVLCGSVTLGAASVPRTGGYVSNRVNYIDSMADKAAARAASRITITFLLISAACSGFMIAWSLRADQLLDCRATWHAADLTQAGNERMMEMCLDQQEQLEVCELGQKSADTIVDKLERDLTLTKAQVVVLRKKCDSPKAEGS